ncbi:hypothetical protein D3C87_574170 [compost metagenome]
MEMKVKRTYNQMTDASFINFEIEGAPQYISVNDNFDEITKLMMDPQIKEMCRKYLLDTLINRIGIIHDYWFDGTEWEEEYGISDDEVFDLVYSDNINDKQKFLDMVKKDLDKMIEFMFNNENIENDFMNWSISFI